MSYDEQGKELSIGTDAGDLDEPSFDVVDQYVTAEISALAAQRASLDNRALALIPISSALVAIYAALQSPQTAPGTLGFWAVLGVCSSIASILLAVSTIFPMRSIEATGELLDDCFSLAFDGNSDQLKAQLVEVKIAQFKSQQRVRALKSRLVGASTGLLAISSVALLAAIVWT